MKTVGKVESITAVSESHVSPVAATNASMARDAAGLRRLLVRTLRGFKKGEVSIQEAHHVGVLSKRTLDAMKIEFLAGPRITYDGTVEEFDEEDDV